jgi:hypothetical protein
MYIENKRALGRAGAPDMEGVSPTLNVLVKAGGTCVGIPRLIFAKAGTAVLVPRRGGEVMVVEPSIKAERGAARK